LQTPTTTRRWSAASTATATHRGELFGMRPSGKRINMRDFHFFRFADGKMVEHWSSVSLS
jgi:predicted ester cyclase